MNNTQLYLSVGVPTLTVILAWVSNRSDIDRLNDKVDRLGEMLHSKMDHQQDSLRAELVALRNDHHKDNAALLGCMIPLHERMAKLEPRE